MIRYGNGTKPYNTPRVEDRIFHAQKATTPSQADRFIAHEIALAIRDYLGREQQPVTPELVEITAEKTLIKTGHAQVAKHYILQRKAEEQEKQRRKESKLATV